MLLHFAIFFQLHALIILIFFILAVRQIEEIHLLLYILLYGLEFPITYCWVIKTWILQNGLHVDFVIWDFLTSWVAILSADRFSQKCIWKAYGLIFVFLIRDYLFYVWVLILLRFPGIMGQRCSFRQTQWRYRFFSFPLPTWEISIFHSREHSWNITSPISGRFLDLLIRDSFPGYFNSCLARWGCADVGDEVRHYWNWKNQIEKLKN